VIAGRYGMSLMWAGPIDQRTYDLYVDAWNEHEGGATRLEGPNARPRVGCTMLVAIGPEDEALEVARRAMEGLVRRTANVHQHDRLILSEEESQAAQGPLRAILTHVEGAIGAGAGTADQIAERWAAFLEPGLVDYVALQLPAGDMTFDEAKHTLELFAAEVKPRLEQASLAV
jgi:alkanesulfonate monooxygenase SsuD/methylene tetrahydromethanopterin reductase-like flavin-dependent oxidoreductase (luciferase family)